MIKNVAVKYMDKVAIEKAIISIATRGAKLDADVQAAGLSIINHIELHGDVTLANRLFNSMAKGMRRNSLALWLCQYGKLEINQDPGTNKVAPMVYAKSGKTDLVEAAKVKWYDVKKEQDLTQEFDVMAKLRQLLKQATKEGVTVKDPEVLAKVSTLIDSMKVE